MILRKLYQLSIEVLPYLVYFPDLSPIDLQFSAYVTIYINDLCVKQQWDIENMFCTFSCFNAIFRFLYVRNEYCYMEHYKSYFKQELLKWEEDISERSVLKTLSTKK